jgi:hypothetical protein
MIQLSRMKGWDPIIRFNLTTYLCKSQARTRISNVIMSWFVFMFNKLRWDVIIGFVDIGRIVDHYCLSFLFTIWND